jgi:hypothetical protein
VNKKKYEPLAKLLRKKRWNKKDVERVKRLLAEGESKARSDSEDRQETIKRLWGLKEKDFGAKTYEERKLNEQKLKEQKFKKLVISVRELAQDNDLIDVVRELREVARLKDRVLSWPELCSLVGELVELALLQDREIEYLTQFRRELDRFQAHCPEQLKDLRRATTHAEVMQIKFPEPTPKRRYELKRRGYRWAGAGVGLIEYEFGGAREADLRKSTILGQAGDAVAKILGDAAANREWQRMIAPTCLDDIFRGGVGEVKMLPGFAGWPPSAVDTRTNMRRVQELFGMHRNRFPRRLPSRTRDREIVYDWRAVVMIMDALLSEKPEERKGARGAPRQIWLSDPDDPGLRTRVLSRIEARIKSLSVPEQIKSHIKAKFLAVVHRHLLDSAHK